MAYTKYSLTPANNTATPPDGAPEGMLPSAVNDTMRDMMAQIRDCGDGIRDGTYTMTAAKITGGTITGTTVTSNTFSSSGATITGGTINGTAIGGTTAAAGKFTTLEATGVSTFAAGTVSAPAITTTGDTNTGIFFPAADTIAFTEGGAEAMRIDSDGDVGIGTSSPSYRLHAVSSAAVVARLGSSGGSGAFVNFIDSGASPSNAPSVGAIGNNLVFMGDGSSSERMRIDSSGNVGIGCTPSAFSGLTTGRLEVGAIGNSLFSNTSSNFWVTSNTNYETGTGYKYATTAAATYYLQSAGTHQWATAASGTAGNAITFTERMRITSGGELLVGATSSATPTNVTSKFVSQGAFTGTNFGASISSTAATGVDHYYISFNTATNTQRGYIYYNNGANQVQLSATSDARLKENIVDFPSALPVLEKVKVRQYAWKETGNINIGFVAQELYDVIPRAVSVGKDNEDGTIQRAWGVDNGTLVPYLVKAIQEQQAMIEELKQEVAALKASH